MARFNKIQNTFSSGEISQQLNARTEIKEYEQGLHTIFNMFTLRGGGVAKREGFFYGRNVSQIPYRNPTMFEYSPIGKNILLVMRTFNGSVPAVDAPLVAYDLDKNNFLNTIPVVTDGTYTNPWISYGFYESNVEIESKHWKYSHYGTLFIMTHASGLVPPIVLSWDGINKLIRMNRITPIGFRTDTVTGNVIIANDPGNFVANGLRIPFQGLNTDVTKTLTVSGSVAIGKPCVVTSNVPIFNPYQYTLPAGTPYNTHPLYIYIEATAGAFVFVQCYQYVSTTVMNGIIMGSAGTIAVATAQTKYSIASWGGNLGWPRTVSVFQDRLIFGGSPSFPDMLWCSASGNIFHLCSRRFLDAVDITGQPRYLGFKGTVADADPFDSAIASDKISSIQWIANNRDLIVGTFDSEYAVGNVDSFFSNSNSFIRVISSKGGYNIKTASAEVDTIFVSSNGKFLMTVSPSDMNYTTTNISTLSEDIISKSQQDLTPGNTTSMSAIQIKLMTWDKGRNILWVVTTTNDIVGLTLSRDSGIIAFHRHRVEGIVGTIESIESATNPYADGSYLWILVNNAGSYDLYYMPQFSNYTQMDNKSPRVEDKPIFMDGMYTSIGSDNGSMFMSIGTFKTGATLSYLHVPRDSWIKLRRGHPFKFIAPTDSTMLPPNLTMGVTYYAIPVIPGTGIPSSDGVLTKDTAIQIATTEANALAGTFVPITVAPTAPLPVLIDARITPATPAWEYWPTFNSENKTLTVLIDGKVIGAYTTDAYGRLHLPGITFNNYIMYGVPYNSAIRTLSLNVGSQVGVALESIERIDRVYALLYASKDGQIGGSDQIFDDIEFDMTNTPTLLETKNPITLMPNSPDVDTFVQIQSKKPLPLTINGLVLRGIEHD